MGALLERLGVDTPVVQAGMGVVSRHELAVAVSEAGGLGTIAVSGARAIRAEVAAARRLTGKPIAVNVLLPLVRRDWWPEAAWPTSSSPSGGGRAGTSRGPGCTSAAASRRCWRHGTPAPTA